MGTCRPTAYAFSELSKGLLIKLGVEGWPVVLRWRGPRSRDRPRGCLERRRDLLLREFPVLLVLLRDVLQEGVICPLRGFEDGFYPQFPSAVFFVWGGVLPPPLRVLLTRQLETS